MPVREVDLLGIDGLDELMNGDLPLPLNADGLLVPEERTRQPTEFVPGVKSIVLPRHHALLKGIYSVVFWLHAHTCTDPLESTSCGRRYILPASLANSTRGLNSEMDRDHAGHIKIGQLGGRTCSRG